MGEHRVPMLGAALRRRNDPAKSRDPQVRQLVAALATLEVAPAPRAEFRAELRTQLVAVTPRLVAEGKAEFEQDQPAGRKARKATRAADAEQAGDARRLRLRKPLIAVVGVLTAFVLLLGGAVLISRNALPGDALYGLKRASENTEYSLASGAVDRGKLKLEFAGNRISEVGDLLSHAGALGPAVGVVADSGRLNAHTAGLVRQTLGSADGDVLTASKLLTGAAVASRSSAPLDNITSWTGDQAATMRQVAARLRGTTLAPRAAHTLNLILGASRHANALRDELGCTCLDSAPTGIYGPTPCSPCTSGKPATPGQPGHQPGQPGRPGESKSAPPGPHPASSSTGNGPHPAPRSSSSAPGSPPSSSSSGGPPTPRSSGPTTPKIPLPSISVSPPPVPGGGHHHTKTPHHPAPTIPVLSSCASISLGPIGIGVGHC